MRFQITTDYAIRMVVYMAQKGTQISTAKEASTQLGITYGYFIKIAAKIRAAGFIESVQGSKGGYRLLKPAKDITLYDIIEIMEGSICLTHCLGEDGFCNQNATQSCQVHSFFKSLQDKAIETLRSVSVYDLV